MDKSAAEAVKWYRKSAESGNAKAQYSLSGMYENGSGVGKDDVEPLVWLQLVSLSGEPEMIEYCHKLEKKLSVEKHPLPNSEVGNLLYL